MMPQLSVDTNISSDVLNAIQTILNVVAKQKKDLASVQHNHDCLLYRIKILESERQKYLQLRDNKSPTDDSIKDHQALISQRKRIKTDCTENEDCTNYNTSKDELNSAFHSSSLEDDVIEPSQYQPYPIDLNKLKKNSPSHRGHRYNEQNKENQNKTNLKAIEKSPTVLSKNSKKVEVKTSPNENESPKWRSKSSARIITPRRIFDNSSTKKEQPSQAKRQVNLSTRKRHSLSLNFNTTRLKQSTLNFPKHEDETYCEGVSTRIDDILMEMNENLLMGENDRHVLQCIPTQLEPKTKKDPVEAVDDDSVASVKKLNEIITIEESQSTQELFKYVADIKKEWKNETPPDSIALPNEVKILAEIQTANINCPECEEYHRMLGRDVKMDHPRKFGVCSKHRRNVPCADTPPGFWNPRIVDSDSDHEDTPYAINH